MATRTLTQLTADVRALADVEAETDRHPDATIQRWINESCMAYRQEFADDPGLWAQTYSGSMTAGSGTIDGSSNFAGIERVIALDVTDGADKVTLAPVPPRSIAEWGADSGLPREFWFVHTHASTQAYAPQIRVYPIPDKAYSYSLTYAAAHTELTSGAHTFEPVLQEGVRWVAADAALRVAVKDENPQAYQMILAIRDDVGRRLRKAASRRGSAPIRRRDTWQQRDMAIGVKAR